MRTKESHEKRLDVLAARWDGMSLCELGRRYTLTRERIRQIENRGLRSLEPVANWIAGTMFKDRTFFRPDDLMMFGERVSKALLYTINQRVERFVWFEAAGCFILREDAHRYSVGLNNFTQNMIGRYRKMNWSDLETRRVERSLAENGLGLMTYGIWLGYIKRKGYEIAGRYIISPQAIEEAGSLRKFKLNLVMTLCFPNGIRLSQSKFQDKHDDYAKLRKCYKDMFGEELCDNDHTLGARLAKTLVLCGKGRYTTESSLVFDEKTLDEIAGWLDSVARDTWYYSEIFEIRKNGLTAAGIRNWYFLKGVFERRFPEKYSYNRFSLSKSGRFEDLTDEFIRYMKTNGLNEVRCSDLAEAFPGIATYVAYQNLRKDSRFECNNGICRLHEGSGRQI